MGKKPGKQQGAAPQGEDAGWVDTPIWDEFLAERWAAYQLEFGPDSD
jgi:hypothetical protein